MTKLHHVKIRSKNCILTSKNLIREFDFKLIAFKDNENTVQIVFTGGQTVFVVTELKTNENNSDPVCYSSTSLCKPPKFDNITEDLKKNVTDNREQDFVTVEEMNRMTDDTGNLKFEGGNEFTKNPSENEKDFLLMDKVCYCANNLEACDDTIYDVAFEVDNVYDCVKSLETMEGEVIVPPTVITSSEGEIIVAVIKSCVGNVYHTLLDLSAYSGYFLPGYQQVLDPRFIFGKSFTYTYADNKLIHDYYTYTDHVTYAVNRGESQSIISWYETIFSMQRFFLNSDDSRETGFVIQGRDVGLRLYALNFWKCAEVGLKSETGNCNIVLAESLEGQGPNQVDTFLSEHGCSGVQHIGLATSDIYPVMEKLSSNGVRFMVPPPTYYTKVGKSDEIESVGEDLSLLRKYGILLDTEADDEKEMGRFLMQVFTAPLFARDTFFLEVIQRKGARGFGAGNITALWRSVEAYLDQKRESTNTT